jgi:hypothetical protein
MKKGKIKICFRLMLYGIISLFSFPNPWGCENVIYIFSGERDALLVLRKKFSCRINKRRS